MAADPTAISQGDILQHAEWVRRLALALVGNPDDAVPMKCTPVTIGGGDKKLTITVPAAWTKPSE